jgi:hypothetical protein
MGRKGTIAADCLAHTDGDGGRAEDERKSD